MINILDLTKNDIGKWVQYTTFSKKEVGRIKSWNDKYIFVVYSCEHQWEKYKNYTAEATNPNDLNFVE